MKTTYRNITIKSIAFIMIAVMGLLIANKSIFLHSHKLDDGTITQHAHPYDKSGDSKPYKSHHHTNAELLFFQNLEILIIVAFLAYVLFTLRKKAKNSSRYVIKQRLAYLNLHKDRAPPIS